MTNDDVFNILGEYADGALSGWAIVQAMTPDADKAVFMAGYVRALQRVLGPDVLKEILKKTKETLSGKHNAPAAFGRMPLDS